MMKKKFINLVTILTMVLTLIANASSIMALTNQVWQTSLNVNSEMPTFNGNSGNWQGIKIDATNGKFAPRTSDTQINANTILTIPVAANEAGANLVFTLSGGSANIAFAGNVYSSNGNVVTIPMVKGTDEAVVTFTSQAYVASISLNYLKDYPGKPGVVICKDKEYLFEQLGSLKDENGLLQSSGKLEGNKGSYEDILVDATDGKFNVQPLSKRVVINQNTKIYLPVGVDDGVSLLIAGTIDGSNPGSIKIDGALFNTNEKIVLDIKNEPKYVMVEFLQTVYVNSIFVDYQSDSGYGVPIVSASDKSWNFSDDSVALRPTLQGSKGVYDGIRIDALTSKFAPREGDTQITGGTVLYLPIAKDDEVALTISGNNYNNLTLRFNNEVINTGVEIVFKADETMYMPLSFEGTGSLYLEGITIDYKSDSVVSNNEVVVGKSALAKYSTIQSALDNEESSSKNPLIINLEDGVYQEKITLNEPYVTLRAISNQKDAVIIKSNYYSSNTFNDLGQFVPQDEKDVGTDQSGTVIVNSKANNFTADNITFVNSYNLEDHINIGEQTPAVALCTNSDKVLLNNCRIIGRQDTLYLKGSGNRVYLNNCYIEGTVDFIFGNANAYFDGCNLHMAYYNGKNNGYFTAPNTSKKDVGIVINNSTLTADSRLKEVSLGRPWQNECYSETKRVDGKTLVTKVDQTKPNPNYENISSAVTYINCTLPSNLKADHFNEWTRKTIDGKTVSVTYKDTVRFVEYNSIDAAGNLLDPDDYNLTLGQMFIVEQNIIDQILEDMRIGNGLGQWLPVIITRPADSIPATPINPPKDNDESALDTGDDVAIDGYVIATLATVVVIVLVLIKYKKKK